MVGCLGLSFGLNVIYNKIALICGLDISLLWGQFIVRKTRSYCQDTDRIWLLTLDGWYL